MSQQRIEGPRAARRLSWRAAVVLAVLLLPGCAILQQLGQSLEAYRPRVSVDSMKLTGISWDSVDLAFALKIDNPNPLSVSMDSFRYTFDVEGKRALAGDQTSGVQLKSYGTSSATLPVKLAWKQLIALGAQLRGKRDLGYALNGALGFQTPLGHVDVPWQKQGRMPALQKPDIRPAGLRLGNVDILGGRAQLLLDLDVSNADGGGAVDLSGFAFDVKLGGRQAAHGAVSQLAAVPAGQTRRATLPLNLRLADIGLAVAKAVTGHGTVPVDLSGTAQVKTPFGTFPLTVARSKTLSVR